MAVVASTGRGGRISGPVSRPGAPRDCCTEGDVVRGMLKLMRRVRRVRPVLPPPSAFTGFRFSREVIVLAVRW
jgi:hypothetical protein